jgi:hypothetical protein
VRTELTTGEAARSPIAAEDDWASIPEYRTSDAEWRYADSTEYLLAAEIGSNQWRIRLNDFPAEPLYTLFVDGRAIIDFNDWPTGWKDKPDPFASD